MDHQPTNQPDTHDTGGSYSQHRTRRHSGGWAGGAILIGLGLLLLLQNLGGLQFENWWALFILIPAIGGLGAAWSNYQEAGGRLTRQVRSSLFGGADPDPGHSRYIPVQPGLVYLWAAAAYTGWRRNPDQQYAARITAASYPALNLDDHKEI
jgi:hypothetical protein